MGSSTSKPYPKAVVLPFYATKELLKTGNFPSAPATPQLTPQVVAAQPSNLVPFNTPKGIKVDFNANSLRFSYEDQSTIQRIGMESNCRVVIQSRAPFSKKDGEYQMSTTYRAICSVCSTMIALPFPGFHHDCPAELIDFCRAHRHADPNQVTVTKVKVTNTSYEPTARRYRTE